MRFANLKKIPPDPAAKLLAIANTKLSAQVRAPASAPVGVVLAELEAAGEHFDMLHLLAVALPPREAVWWACLAARDVLSFFNVEKMPPPLDAAEKWVFKPTDENRMVAREALDTADIDDDTVHCALAALYAEGTLGPGELADFPAPPSAVSTSVFTMNMISLKVHVKVMGPHCQMLIDRALDIARGGNGRVEAKADATQDT